MNKSAKRQFVKCNLKQTDIFTAFENWKTIKKEKEMKKADLYGKVIVIDDSDAEETMSTIFLKKKRPLAMQFSDDDDDDDNTKGIFETTTPMNNSQNVTINGPNGLMEPIACSTPLSSQECTNTLNKFHVGIQDVLEISNIESEGGATTRSENTILPEPNSNQNDTTIQIRQHIILLPSPVTTINKTSPDQPLSKSHGRNGSQNSPGTKRCAEGDRNTKKQKTNCSQEETVVVTRNVHNISTTLQNTPKICAEEDKNVNKQKANHLQKTVKIRDVNTSATQKRSTVRWLSKKERLIEYSNGNKSNKPRQEKNNNEEISEPNKSQAGLAQGDKPVNGAGSTLNSSSVAPKQSGTMRSSTDDKDKSKCSLENKIFAPGNNSPHIPAVNRALGKNKVNSTAKNIKKNSVGSKTKTTETVGQKSKAPLNPDLEENIPSTSRCQEPTQRTNLNESNASSGRNSVAKKEEKKEKRMNKEPLRLITDLFKNVLSSRHVNNILDAERRSIRIFLDMNDNYQYVCFKLITRQKKWYNAYKFCNLIYVDLDETEIADMVDVFNRHRIIDTDYIKESPMQLLPRLENTDLRGICDTFKLKKTIKNKEDMVRSLLKYSNTQTTLTIHKTTKDLLMEHIRFRMGKCMRINEEFLNAFHSIFLLGTFVNPRFVTIKEYLDLILGQKIIFPQYSIDDYTIFRSRNEFISFAKAKRYRDALEEEKDPLECLQISKTVFAELRSLENDINDHGMFEAAPHLVKFTAKAVYVSTLSHMVENLFCKFPDDVKTWLEYLIENVDCPHKIGRWYYHLVWLYMRYLKPFNYDQAAQLLIEVLEHKREHLSEVQLYHLRKRGEQLICTRKYKILQIHHDCIAKLLPKRIKAHEFPETTVDAKTIRSNELGLKRNYEVSDQEGNKTIMQVEEIALSYYLNRLRYTGGQHCEGAFIKATFTLFFFDIIYSKTKCVPGTFVSNLQSEPLDMNSRYFYPKRKDEINQRLREIDREWTDAYLLKFVKDNYEKHSHEFSICEVGRIITDPWLLEVLVECIGRQILAKIYERLVKNFREYRSGLPDLLVWNVDTKESKFVEVKGEHDKLSIGQTLWLDYLQKIGANIEVCHVHSIGSKRKVKKDNLKGQQEASTSSC